jgi:DNA-directed RNA polymerase subunit RPC12/RpoP
MAKSNPTSQPSSSREQVYPLGQSFEIVRDYRCAICWGQLSESKIPYTQTATVTCLICGGSRGLVAKEYVEYRAEQARHERLEALANIGHIVNPGPRRSEKEILADLGY